MNRLDYLRTIRGGELTWSRLVEAAANRLREIPHRIAWETPSPVTRANHAALESFRDIHRGKRCFVIANGPSLQRTDLSRLAGEGTIGMNRIYRMGTFMPTYLVVMDIDTQLEAIGKELEGVSVPKFLNWNGRRLVRNVPGTVFLKPTYRPRFSTDLHKGIWGGHSVTYACLQLAYWMGVRTAILVGKDHDYTRKGVPGSVVTASDTETNHGIPGYYRAGQKYRIPDYRGEELAYRAALTTFSGAGGSILDATVGGKLQVFPKVAYESLF